MRLSPCIRKCSVHLYFDIRTKMKVNPITLVLAILVNYKKSAPQLTRLSLIYTSGSHVLASTTNVHVLEHGRLLE